MKAEEVIYYCKVMSDKRNLLVIVSLIKNGMMTSRQICKYCQTNIPDSVFAKLLYLEIIKVSKYGVFSLGKGVDDVAFIVSNVDFDDIDTSEAPDISNESLTYGYYVEKVQDAVYVVKDKNDNVLSKHILKKEAVDKLRNVIDKHKKKNSRPNSKDRRKRKMVEDMAV